MDRLDWIVVGMRLYGLFLAVAVLLDVPAVVTALAMGAGQVTPPFVATLLLKAVVGWALLLRAEAIAGAMDRSS